MDNRAPASIAVIVGSTGSGKSSGIRCALEAARPDRLMVFDPGEDYTAFGAVFRNVRALYAAAVKAGQGPFRAVLVPMLDQARERAQFNDFCLIAFAAANVVVVADELEDVMLPTWAPAGWNMLVRRGRKRGVRIVGASQRPAGLEKRVWSFATTVRSGRLAYAEDAAVIAARLRVTPDDILSLPPLHWVQWAQGATGATISRGRIEWHGGRPREVVTGQGEPGAAASQ